MMSPASSVEGTHTYVLSSLGNVLDRSRTGGVSEGVIEESHQSNHSRRGTCFERLESSI